MGKRHPTALAGHSATLTPQRATYATSALFLRIHRQFSALRYRRGYTPRPIGISRDFMRIRAGADARSVAGRASDISQALREAPPRRLPWEIIGTSLSGATVEGARRPLQFACTVTLRTMAAGCVLDHPRTSGRRGAPAGSGETDTR